MKYKVTFTRVYEIDESLVLERLDDDEIISSQDEKELKKEIVLEIANDWFADEMPMFLNNPEGFASANVELKTNHTMNLYKLSQTENRGWDTFDSCVVCAKNEDDAKSITPDEEEFVDLMSQRLSIHAVLPND